MSAQYPRRLKDAEHAIVGNNSSTRTNNQTDSNELDCKTKCETQNQTASNLTDTTQRVYPKRSSELPKLDSDSDDSNDNFNCAILNDSFLMSPCKNEQNDDVFLAAETPASKLLNKLHQQESYAAAGVGVGVGDANESISFVSRFNSMDLNTSTEPIELARQRLVASTACKPSAGSKLEIIQENVKQEDAAGEVLAGKQRTIDDETPFKAAATTADAKVLPSNQAQITANKPGGDGTQFATPQIRAFSVQRRPRDLCSTQSQKSRLAAANEFRSQKVLFQTPIALSRAPLTCLPNDSVTLSLCDTINEAGSTPNTCEKSMEKCATANKDAAAPTKTKKSLDGAFADVGKENQVNTATNAANAKPESALKRSSSRVTINNVEYQVIKKLGCGGSSSVYLGQRLDNEFECALKVVDLQGDPAVVEGYMNETKLLEKLQGNICVVGLYDYQLLKQESKLLLVMEKGDSDLQKILQGYTTNLPLYVLMNYLYQMLQAVNYIHQNGVIHSDLKPANFLMVNGRLKLIDFGIASNIAIDSTSIIKFSQAGTFNYISPEALTDTSTGSSPIRRNQPKIKISTKSDVWSLGCILYLFLYQKTPFSHIKNIYAKINAITSPATDISFPAIPAYYPIILVHMLKKCLQHNPKERPSCAELLQYPFHMIIPTQHLIVPTTRSSKELQKQTQL